MEYWEQCEGAEEREDAGSGPGRLVGVAERARGWGRDALALFARTVEGAGFRHAARRVDARADSTAAHTRVVRASPPLPPPPCHRRAPERPLHIRGLAFPCVDLAYERWRTCFPVLVQLPAPERVEQLRLLLLDSRWPAGPSCPRCGSDHVVRWGKSPTGPRYRCRGGCGRTFGLTSCTPLAYTKRLAHWPTAAHAMIAGASVRATARVARIHPATAFRWRHRLLAALARREPTEQLRGLVEVEELFVRCTMKGPRGTRVLRDAASTSPEWLEESDARRVCVLLACDRARRRLAVPVSLARPMWQDVHRVLGPCVRHGSALCVPAGFAYRSCCRVTGWRLHLVTPPGRGQHDARHRRNVCRLGTGFRRWIRRFRGTRLRYLRNYLCWHLAVVSAAGRRREAAAEWLLLGSCR